MERRVGVLALSIRQPWAELVVRGWKTIENRDWQRPPRYQGPVAIHASLRLDRAGIPGALSMLREAGVDPAALGAPEALPRGAYVGVALLGGGVRLDDLGARLHLTPGQQIWWAWGHEHVALHMVGAARFEAPIPGRGRLGLYPPPPEVGEAALELARHAGAADGRRRR